MMAQWHNDGQLIGIYTCSTQRNTHTHVFMYISNIIIIQKLDIRTKKKVTPTTTNL